MPESFPQRRHPRYPAALSIVYWRKGAGSTRAGIGRTRNVSGGGACLELPEVLPLGTPLSVDLPTDPGELRMEAQVVWVGGPGSPGGEVLHGVSFIEVTAEQHQALWELVNRLAQRDPAGVSVPVRLSVLCRPRGDAGPPLQGETGDLGRGGLSVRLKHRLSPATVVELTLPTSKGPRTMEASVVWLAPPEAQQPGEPIWHGLRFRDPRAAAELTLGLLQTGVPDAGAWQQAGRPRPE